MNVKPFAQVCASCHLQQVVGTGRASGPQGVALLTLPGIDLQTIEEKGQTVGEWPSDSEAELTPMMKLLLGGSAPRRALLAKVEKLDLLDLTKASSAEVTAVVRLAWEIKRLLHSLMATKTSEVLRGLRRTTGVNVDQKRMTQLIATLPRDVLVNAQRDWLPNLGAEITKLHELGWAVSTNKKKVISKNTKGKTQKKTEPKSNDVDQTPPDRLTTNPKFGRWIINAVGDLVQEGDTTNVAPTEVSENDQPEPTETQDTPSDDTVRDGKVKSTVSAEAWAEFGGWYRKDYAILYKPTGHADSFMQAWLDFSGHAFGSKGAKLAAPVFQLLTDKSAQGQCTKCHSVDAGTGKSRQVQWAPSSIANKKQRFTKFIHEPHFRLLDDRGCLTCHEMGKVKNFVQTYQSLSPARVQSNFKQMKKELCITCHKQNAARQDCLLCHDYHVAPISTPIMSTKLPGRSRAPTQTRQSKP